MKRGLFVLTIFCLSIRASAVGAESATMAIASNFSIAAKALKVKFEAQTEHKLRLVFGSSGKLAAQIKQGAPFDLFMSADKKTALDIEMSRFGLPGSHFKYAQGRLALWSKNVKNASLLKDYFSAGDELRVAIANPRLAPYGMAAQQVLDRLERSLTSRLKVIRGENVAQAYHFAATGAVDLAFVAYSQSLNTKKPLKGEWFLIPADWHDSIAQYGVVLSPGAANQAVSDFVAFILADEQQAQIGALGYAVNNMMQEGDVLQ